MWKLGVALAALAGAAMSAEAAQVGRAPFGTLRDGRTVEAVTLANHKGMRVRLISYGASIQTVVVPDRHGTGADVTLGYPTLQGYLDQPQYFGSTVGRV